MIPSKTGRSHVLVVSVVTSNVSALFLGCEFSVLLRHFSLLAFVDGTVNLVEESGRERGVFRVVEESGLCE